MKDAGRKFSSSELQFSILNRNLLCSDFTLPLSIARSLYAQTFHFQTVSLLISKDDLSHRTVMKEIKGLFQPFHLCNFSPLPLLQATAKMSPGITAFPSLSKIFFPVSYLFSIVFVCQLLPGKLHLPALCINVRDNSEGSA